MASEIVGRQEELLAIEKLLDEDRLPAALVLEGEAGIGKTTLWRAGVELAWERGFRVLVARPASAESEMPFAGLGDLLGGCIDELASELPDPQRRAIDTALLLADPGTAPPQPHVIATAVLSSLRALAREQRLLVAIDDVQWIDAPSAAALEFAVRRVEEGLELALLLGWRTEGGESAPLGLGGALQLSADRRNVGPLSLGALHRVITDRLGHALPRPMLVRIHEASEGNPFFALELAHAVERRGGTLPTGEMPLPASVGDALRERLDEVSSETRDALLAVALLGPGGLDVVEAALGREARAALEPALEARILVLDEGSLRFAHPLMRSAVYAESWPSRRREWHRRLAGAVVDPDERAHHLALGLEGTDHVVAAALDEAAHRARARGAPEAAATLAEQAWRATPLEDAAARWRRGRQAAEYHMQSGDLERFRALSEELLSAAQSGDERSQAYAVLSLAARRTGGPPAAVPLLERALAAAESVEQRQSVESDLVSLAILGGNVEAGADHAREALRLAEELDDPATLADALALVAAAEQVLGRGLRRDLLERADALTKLRQTDSMAETTGVLRNLYNWAGVLATADEFEAARARFDAAERLISAQQLVQHLPELHRGRADLECWSGDWVTAMECVEACEEAAEQTGQQSKLEDVLYARAFVLAHRGDVEEARAVASDGLARAEESGSLRGLLRHLAVVGFLDLSVGDAESAGGHLERALEAAETGGFHEPGRTRFHGDLAEALTALGRIDEAEAVVERLERSSEITRYPWATAIGARCRALVLGERQDLDGAVASLDASLAAHERLGNPFERARTLLVLGVVHRRSKRRADARVALQEAQASLETLGATLWSERVASELTRIPGRRASDRDELSETERRIAELVAEGRSNKEVAAALFVTVKTVEAGLTRIYRKLGVRSRAELAHQLAAAAKE